MYNIGIKKMKQKPTITTARSLKGMTTVSADSINDNVVCTASETLDTDISQVDLLLKTYILPQSLVGTPVLMILNGTVTPQDTPVQNNSTITLQLEYDGSIYGSGTNSNYSAAAETNIGKVPIKVTCIAVPNSTSLEVHGATSAAVGATVTNLEFQCVSLAGWQQVAL